MKDLTISLAAAAALCFAARATPASAAPLKNIVLVHGAWVDASGWKPVYDILTREGFHVSMVQEPETSFADDVAATKRVLDLQDGPTLLVGHSYGGSIITEAGVHPNVVGLVYVAAHAPDVGEDEAALGKKTPSVLAKTAGRSRRHRMNSPISTRPTFPKLFAPDLPREQAEFVARSQVLAAAKVFSTPLTAAAWKTKPSWGIVAGERPDHQPGSRALVLATRPEPHDRNPGRQPLRLRVRIRRKSRRDHRGGPQRPAKDGAAVMRVVHKNGMASELRSPTRPRETSDMTDVARRRYQKRTVTYLAHTAKRATPASAAPSRQDRRGARRHAGCWKP